MNTLRYRITVLSLLTTFVLGMLTAGAQAQTRLDIRAASKAEFKKRSSRMDESKYKLPEWWIEVPKGGLPKVGFPNHERVGISPIPTPIPHPVPHHERDEVELGNLSSFMEQLLEMYEDATDTIGLVIE